MVKEANKSPRHKKTRVWIAKFVFSVVLLLSSLSLRGADFNPFAGPKPIAVFIQTDPWAMAIGSDTPRVAVYDDGTVIFVKESDHRAAYYNKKLSEQELSEFKRQLAPVLDLKELKPSYNLLPQISDQPEALIYIRTAERQLATRVYGLKAPGTRLPAYSIMRGTNTPDAVPPQLIELHKFLCSIDYPDSKEWIPDYLEVMLWPYKHWLAKSIIWPKDWPGLDSYRAVKRGEGQYSIFLDGTMLPELEKFLRTRKGEGAVKIGGRKWLLGVRRVFPGEPAWRKAFQN